MSRHSLLDNQNPIPPYREQNPPPHVPIVTSYQSPNPVSQCQPIPHLYHQSNSPPLISPCPWSNISNPVSSWYGIQPDTYSPVHTNLDPDFGVPPEPIKSLSRGAHVPCVNKHLARPENYFD